MVTNGHIILYDIWSRRYKRCKMVFISLSLYVSKVHYTCLQLLQIGKLFLHAPWVMKQNYKIYATYTCSITMRWKNSHALVSGDVDTKNTISHPPENSLYRIIDVSSIPLNVSRMPRRLSRSIYGALKDKMTVYRNDRMDLTCLIQIHCTGLIILIVRCILHTDHSTYVTVVMVLGCKYYCIFFNYNKFISNYMVI